MHMNSARLTSGLCSSGVTAVPLQSKAQPFFDRNARRVSQIANCGGGIGLRIANVAGARRVVVSADEGHPPLVNEDVDSMTASGEPGDELGRAAGNAARIRGPRREPGESHSPVVYRPPASSRRYSEKSSIRVSKR